jgi:predicted NAD-dependent protein-ADP-ribosyltransferase YbiA (DUF1768 family)
MNQSDLNQFVGTVRSAMTGPAMIDLSADPLDEWEDGVAVIVRPGSYAKADTVTNGDFNRRHRKNIRGGVQWYGTKALIDIPGAIDKGLTALAGDPLDALIERGIRAIRTLHLGAETDWFVHACEHAGLYVNVYGTQPTPPDDPCTWSECTPLWPLTFGPNAEGDKNQSFSNFNMTTPVFIEGVAYPSAEHAYHALKSEDAEYRRAILNCTTPENALHESRKLLKNDGMIERERKEDIMRRVQKARVQQNPHMQEQLLKSGTRELRELSDYEPWGGQTNLMGRILMEERYLLQQANPDTSGTAWTMQVDQHDRPMWEPMDAPEASEDWFDAQGNLLNEKDRPQPDEWAARRKVRTVSKLQPRHKPANGKLATIVTGDRLLNGMEWYVTVATAIQPYHVVISGGAKGADSMARDACKARTDVEFIEIKARWDELGKRAGYERNREMLNKLLWFYYEGYDIDVHAFHTDLFTSKGTKMMVDLALEKGVSVTLHDVQDEPADSTPAFVSTHQSIVEAAQPVLNYTPAF